MPATRNSISVVIPTFNGRQLLEENLPSVFAALLESGVEHEVIVVDDDSSDDTAQFLATTWPAVHFIQSPENQGFSPTMNLGIRAAQLELVFALNNDVRLEPGYFKPLFHFFDDPNTFGTTGKIIGYDDDRVQDTAKWPIAGTAKIWGTANYLIEGSGPPAGFWQPSFILTGANALLNREKLLLLGGYDELFAPFNWEDVDLSLRAWRMGWFCWHEPTSICRHPSSSTIKKYHRKRATEIISNRNKWLLHVIHLPKRGVVLFGMKMLGKSILAAFLLKTGHFKSLGQFLGRLGQAAVSRKNLKNQAAKNGIRLRPLTEIKREITDRLAGFELRIF